MTEDNTTRANRRVERVLPPEDHDSNDYSAIPRPGGHTPGEYSVLPPEDHDSNDYSAVPRSGSAPSEYSVLPPEDHDSNDYSAIPRSDRKGRRDRRG
jgi:hypothetical protein